MLVDCDSSYRVSIFSSFRNSITSWELTVHFNVFKFQIPLPDCLEIFTTNCRSHPYLIAFKTLSSTTIHIHCDLASLAQLCYYSLYESVENKQRLLRYLLTHL